MKEQLKKIRGDLGLTQAQFAEQTGKTRDIISNYEQGRVLPDETFILLLYEKYGYNLDWIRTGKGEPKERKPYAQAGAEMVGRAMQQDLNSAKAYLQEYFRDWPEEEILLASYVLQKRFPKKNPAPENSDTE